MKLSKIVKDYLNKEIIKETTCGYSYRMIDGKRCKINPSETPDDYIRVCNSTSSYGGFVGWELWVKDPNNKYFDVYRVNAKATLNTDWDINLNYYNLKHLYNDDIPCYIGTRHYADKTSIGIYYNTRLDRLEAAPISAYWRSAKQPIEIYDNDPSIREPERCSLNDLSHYRTTVNDKNPSIWEPSLANNWRDVEFSSEIRQIIYDVYDLTNFLKAYPNGVRKPQDLLNLLKTSDEELIRKAKARKNNEDSIAEYKEATKGLIMEDTAVKIGDKIYFNRNDYYLYVKNIKNNTLVCYTDFNGTAAKSATPKNGATRVNDNIFSQTYRTLFKGCFDENGEQISFAECFGKQSNVTTFFEYCDAPEDANVILNLFTIRGQYAKILELAIKSQNKFLIQKILERKMLTKEQYDKKSSWTRSDLMSFDGTKTNIPQMLNVNKYIVNQIKNLPVNQDVRVIEAYMKLSTLFSNLSITDFLEVYRNQSYYYDLISFCEQEALARLFAKDGLQTFKKRMAAYGSVIRRYNDYLRMIEQLKALSETDSTVTFNPSEWPLFPEAAIKHVTLYRTETYYGNTPIEESIYAYTKYTLNNVKYTVLSKTEEQAILELNLSPAQHLIYLESELTKLFNLYRDKAKSEAFKHSIERLKAYEFTDGTLSVVAPTQASDLTTEGAVLHHCVASFIDAVSNNKENVVFIRRNDMIDEPYYTMAISPSGIIEQVHCAYNGNLSKEGQATAYQRTGRDVYNTRFDLIKFLKQWATAMNKKGVKINPTSIRESYGALGARH